MKKSIRFNTDKGITGEIRFDSDSVDFIECNATVVFDDGREPVVGNVYNSGSDDIVHIILKSPIENNGKEYSVMGLVDRDAKSEYRKIKEEVRKEQQWKEQNTLTEKDLQDLDKPFFYSIRDYTHDIDGIKMDPENKIYAMTKKYAIDHNVDQLISRYYVRKKFRNSKMLREKVENEGFLTDDGSKKAEISDEEIESLIEEYFEEFFAEIREKEERRLTLIKKAKETGVPQVLYTGFDGCNDPKEDCDLDVVTTYIDGEGKTEICRQHTW